MIGFDCTSALRNLILLTAADYNITNTNECLEAVTDCRCLL